MNADTDTRSDYQPAISGSTLFVGPDDVRTYARSLDWSSTGLGLVESWPPSLRTIVATILATPTPMVVLWGPDHIQIYNDAYRALMGAKHPRGFAQPYRECWPEVWESDAPNVDGVLRRGESFTVADQRLVLDRFGAPEESFWTLTFSPIIADDGAVGGVLATVSETTRQVRARSETSSERASPTAEEALRESEARYRLALDVAELGTWTWDLTSGRGDLDDRGAEIVGLPPGQLPDVAAAQFARVHPDDLAALQATAAAGIAGGQPFTMNYRVTFEDGSIHYVLSRARVLTDDAHQPIRLIGTNRDVTAEHEANAERERLLASAEAARDAAEAANRSKSEFLAVMSHELRTPLNAIGGYAELLELGVRGPVTDAQRADLGRIQHSQRHLLGLINQVLNYARVDAGAVRYDLARVPVADALLAAESLVLPQVRARGISYVLGSCPPGLTVRADAEKLQQILLNLLSNAIKFTDRGGSIHVSCTAADGMATMAVADTGVGISADKLASIFDPFVQVDQGLTRPHEGVGLGLAISRELARGMGGDVTAASTLGEGSVFRLMLPIAPAR